MRVDLANQLRGVLKPFGLIAGRGGGQAFADRVRALVANGPLQAVAEALLAAWQAITSQVAILTRRLIVMARQDQAVKRLMTTPGVGTLVALTYVSVIDQPGRYRQVLQRRRLSWPDATALPIGRGGLHRPHLALRGRLLRSYLFSAAGILLHRVSRWSALKAWGTRLAKRIGSKKATVAVARKLAVILHRLLRDGTEFRWSAKQGQAA